MCLLFILHGVFNRNMNPAWFRDAERVCTFLAAGRFYRSAGVQENMNNNFQTFKKFLIYTQYFRIDFLRWNQDAY
jgi:hypothetical protein